ncbi:hypothetical protein BI147_19090 [Achromobacter xylosoxidans]|jgi:predicted Zn-dependent protease|nr:hypothetical protein HMPREF2939_02570 [Achromobacter xylosoxidans]OMG90169.1 hypothetical protein BI147_19090 [Achromobacter xylosoxidans]CUI27988.1 Uncharacterised protein [Achromobacter xylosoxidans]CUJ13729.1 Uncharacterised protein [Achromobacter xylosoxidans]CUR76671.1 hypothetical protein BN2910_12560 [Achromobacter xylosoxidans]
MIDRGGAGTATAVSDETAFVLDADDARILAEVGFLAAGRGDVAHADSIFLALRALRPGRAYPWLGLAVARLNADSADEAVRLLEQGEVSAPGERALLTAWRGLALQLAGRKAESTRLLRACAQGGEGDEGAALARSLLGLQNELNDDRSR